MSDSIHPPRVVGTPDADATAENDPELAALLDFEAAPRKVNRPDGWTPERQRRFIELIAQTGSPQQAARAMGKVLSGVEEVYRGEGAEGFRAAWDGVCELVRRREEARLRALGPAVEPPHRSSVAGMPHTHPGPLAAGEGAPNDLPTECAVREDLVQALFGKFVLKIRAERTARLAGRIAEADFYARQIAFFEVAIELSHPAAMDAFEELRRDGVGIVDIAETESTHMLDGIRRKAWLEWELDRISSKNSLSPVGGEGDSAQAERGEGAAWEGEGAAEDLLAYEPDDDDPFDLFPRHLLADHRSTGSGQGFRTEPLPCVGPYKHPAEGYTDEQWAGLDQAERKRAYADQYARAAAEEQVKWEAEMLGIARAVKETGHAYGEPLSASRERGRGAGG